MEEIKEAVNEESWEMEVVFGLVIFVVIFMVVVGLLVAWFYCKEGGEGHGHGHSHGHGHGEDKDLAAQRKPGVQKK